MNAKSNRRAFLCLPAISIFLFSNLLFSQNSNSWKIFDDSEIAVVEIEMDTSHLNWILDIENAESDSLHLATIHFKNALIDEIVDSVGIRIRGNTSRFSSKKSFKLSFNTFIPGRKFYDLDKINLNGEHNDPSITRSKICWDLFQKINMKSSRASHSALYINGEYFGVYANIEHIDEEFIRKNFKDRSGNLWKCLWPADLAYLGDNPENYKLYRGDRQLYDLKTNTDISDYSKLARFIRIINNTPPQHLKDSLEKVLHVPTFIKYMAMDVLTGSWDDYWFLKNNYYLYHEPASDLIYIIPYDYDNSFGIDWFGIDWATINPYTFARNDNSPRPLIDAILRIPEYKNLYTHFLDLLNNNVFKMSFWDEDLNKIEQMLTPYVVNDIYRTLDYGFTLNDFHDSYGADHFELLHVKRAIREFANERFTSVNNQLQYQNFPPVIYSLEYDPQIPEPDDSLYFSVNAFGFPSIKDIKLFSRFESGEFIPQNMMYSPVEGSLLPEDSDKWRVTIPPVNREFTGEFYLEVINENNLTVRYPANTNIFIYSGSGSTGELLINEIMAGNSNTISDENGEFDDWFEIYNPSTIQVNLKGKFLTDSKNNLSKWQFENDLVIGPQEIILIWCDEDSSQGILHTNFKLNRNGEFLAIVDSDSSTFLDSLSYPQQKEDTSYGRNVDDLQSWSFMEPTPGEMNTLVGVDGDKIILPTGFEVANYPNPFNPSTNIVIYIPERSDISIEIFNTLGERVWRKELGSKAPGRYKIEWNALKTEKGKLSSGVYIAQVFARSKTKFIKLLLLK